MNITITARMMKQKYDWKEKAGQYEISFDFPDHLIESIDPGNLFKFALQELYEAMLGAADDVMDARRSG